MQDYFSLTLATHTEKCCVEYLDVLDAVADSKDTIMKVPATDSRPKTTVGDTGG